MLGHILFDEAKELTEANKTYEWPPLKIYD